MALFRRERRIDVVISAAMFAACWLLLLCRTGWQHVYVEVWCDLAKNYRRLWPLMDGQATGSAAYYFRDVAGTTVRMTARGEHYACQEWAIEAVVDLAEHAEWLAEFLEGETDGD